MGIGAAAVRVLAGLLLLSSLPGRTFNFELEYIMGNIHLLGFVGTHGACCVCHSNRCRSIISGNVPMFDYIFGFAGEARTRRYYDEDEDDDSGHTVRSCKVVLTFNPRYQIGQIGQIGACSKELTSTLHFRVLATEVIIKVHPLYCSRRDRIWG